MGQGDVRRGVFPVGTLLMYAPEGAVEMAWLVVGVDHVAAVRDPFSPCGMKISFPPTLRGWGRGWTALPPRGVRLDRRRVQGPSVESWDFSVVYDAV